MESKILEVLKQFNPNLSQEKVRKALEFGKSNESEVFGVLDLILSIYPERDTILSLLIKEAYLNGKIDDLQVKKYFGQDVLNIVGGIKKLKNANYAENEKGFQLEILRKMFLAMAKDLRVIIIDLADRLYKMQNLENEPDSDKKYAFAKETLDLYVPIADRLGVYSIKIELEDLAFSYIKPEDYKNISEELKNLRESCNVSIGKIKKQLDEFFQKNDIDVDVSGRIKSIYSIYKKLKKKGLSSVTDLYDIFAMRIVLRGKNQMDKIYAILGLLHSEWKPISKRFKDYIAVPKTNGYRSLHTVVLGLAPKDMEQPVEIQIRDEIMNNDAEYGVAAHWLYKESPLLYEDNVQSKVEWLRTIEKIKDEFGADEDFVNTIEIDAFKDRIFVLTPRGEVKDLPAGSSPVDFAYAVHTDVGHKCVMAKVDGRVVPLGYDLKNGEMVEIVTRKDATPKLQWLSMVKTGFARNRIKAWFSGMNKENNLKEGRRLLNSQLERIGKPLLDQNFSILKNYLGEKLNLSQREGLVEEVGKGGKMAHDIVKKIYPYEHNIVEKVVKEREHVGIEDHGGVENQILVGGESGLPVKLAACCKPKFGDSIVGYVPRGNRVTIHNIGCNLLHNLNSERLVFAQWRSVKSAKYNTYRVSIKLLLMTRIGLMKDMVSIISDLGIDIVDVQIKPVKGGLNENHFLLDMVDPDQFDLLMDRLEHVKGVLKVSRVARANSGV